MRGHDAPMPRVTVRSQMVGVAVVAGGMVVLLAAARLATELSYSTWSHGPNTSVFPIGQEVATSDEVRVDGLTIPAGTPGVVTGDPPDEDSAYPGRLVGVRITGGPHRGTTRGIIRRSLRAR